MEPPKIEDVRKGFIGVLVEKGALKIASSRDDMFKLKSGRSSPHFINMGALTDGESLKAVKRAYAGAVAGMLKQGILERFEYVFGPAYKGISLGALLCEGLTEYGINARFLYDRKEEKSYGDKAADKLIVGGNHFVRGGRILIVDDVITTGGTKVDTFKKLEALGEHKVVGIIVAIDREERMGDSEHIEEKSASQSMEERYGVKVYSIGTVSDIFSHIEERLTPEVKEAWLEYRHRYGTRG